MFSFSRWKVVHAVVSQRNFLIKYLVLRLQKKMEKVFDSVNDDRARLFQIQLKSP